MKPYPRYKPSGVEWLGEIPEHWETGKLKFTDEVIMGQSPSSEDYNDCHSGLPFLQGNAEFGRVSPTPKIWCDTASKIAIDGDILLSVRAPIGAVNIADQKYGIGRGLCSIRAVKSYNVYLYYLLSCLGDELNSIGTGSTFTAVSADQIKNLRIPSLPISEQRRIAGYLDGQLHGIHSLSAKKQKLIELLKEQRTAIINQAVTKGLNPNVKMKDSGVEWLGEIPEHWDVIPAKHVSSIFVPQRNKPQLNQNSGFPWITMDDITSHSVENSIAGYYVTELDARSADSKILPSRSVIASCIGNFGIAAVNTIPVIINQQLQAYIPTRVNPWFLRYVVTISRPYFEEVSTATTLAYVNREKFGRMPTVLPPRNEQDAIISFLDCENSKIDLIISKSEAEIAFLQEYRIALVSEVVTGKIDVRAEVVP